MYFKHLNNYIIIPMYGNNVLPIINYQTIFAICVHFLAEPPTSLATHFKSVSI